MRYVTLSVVVLLAIFVAVKPWRADFPHRTAGYTLLVLSILTLIFDNMLVGLHIVEYYQSAISGIRLGAAPIEDFAYTIAVCLIVPRLWQRWYKS